MQRYELFILFSKQFSNYFLFYVEKHKNLCDLWYLCEIITPY